MVIAKGQEQGERKRGVFSVYRESAGEDKKVQKMDGNDGHSMNVLSATELYS